MSSTDEDLAGDMDSIMKLHGDNHDDDIPSTIATSESSTEFNSHHHLPPPLRFPSRPELPRHRSERRSGIQSIRSISTQEREYGKKNAIQGGANFAVQSIRRGSQEWRQLVKPFVADLAFYSLQSRKFARKPLFLPYTCQAAVLFVDISGYSKIASVLAHKGAHALSTAVNSYLSILLRIIQQYGGDVVKFAGDAVLCVWQGQMDKLNTNVLCAAQCALELQDKAGTHPVEGTEHEFKIHIGLCCGGVESEIFSAPTHTQMQRMYHLVGGSAIEEIGDLVDLAKSGEVCVSDACLEQLQKYSPSTTDIPEFSDAKLLTGLQLNRVAFEEIETHVEDEMMDRLQRRDLSIEEDFIHPAVLDLLSHGGLSPTQIAQMRDLVVLFIAQTSRASPVNWLLEVQTVLDRHQCPLLQIVADDKGVHAIAAVNGVNAVPESRLLGLEICRELRQKKIGIAIGMAAGSTFCGVTGSSSVACRWDITGGPPVRSARLMQYALKNNLDLAIDESVYVGSTVPARMALLRENIPIKGSPAPIRVFTLSEATEFAAMKLLETVHGEMHNDQVQQITKHITGFRNRSCVVVTGPTLAGKKIVCQRAAGFADMVPFLHVADESYGLLQLAHTIATWFKYVPNDEIRRKACTVKCYLDKKLLSCAHDECVMLVDLAIEAGLVSCFIVDRVEFLDEYSFSLMRECLHGRFRKTRASLFKSTQSIIGGATAGRISFLCVHVPFYNSPAAKSVVEDITRSHKNLSVPIIEVAEATLQQFRELTSTMSGDGIRSMRQAESTLDDRVLYVGSAAAGHLAGYFIERAAAIAQMQPGRLANGKKLLVHMTEDLMYRIPPGCLRGYRTIPVMDIGSEIAMRYAHVYDDLPPMMQVFCKVLAVVSQTGFWWAPRARVWEVLNDLIAEGVDDDVMSILLQEMAELYLIKTWTEDGVEFVKFLSPALSDIALDVCTPIQVQSIAAAWLERLSASEHQEDFRVSLVLAWLHIMIDKDVEQAKELWRQGFAAVLKESEKKHWNPSRLDRWKELIACEIEAGGGDVDETLAPGFAYGGSELKSVDFHFFGVWSYRGPIGLGPLGNTLSVITQQVFQELLLFSDKSCPVAKEQSLKYFQSASKRYMVETKLVEELLSAHDLGMEPEELQKEQEHVLRIAAPATSKDEVYKKADIAMNTFIPRFVESRLQRLHSLTQKLDSCPVPDFVSEVKCRSVREAYRVMFEDWGCKCLTAANEVDSAQHALMMLATLGWKPRPTPEALRHLGHQTVARIRNAVVRKLSPGQLFFQKHQQGAVDLKAFLVTTALLFHAEDTGNSNGVQ